jgi:hypothetical protein
MDAERLRRIAPSAALGLVLVAAAGVTLWSMAGAGPAAPPEVQAPAPFSFQESRQRIPGSLVRSASVALAGFEGPLEAAIGGAAEQLLVNGKPVLGATAVVSPGDKVAVAVRAPAELAATAVGTLRVGASAAEFRVTSVRKPPADGLAFGEAEAAPGRSASSALVAPVGFAPGAALLVDGPGVKVETREGRFDPPVTLAPGEPFRLVARVPEGSAAGPIEVGVELGELRGTWTVRVR